ncbi:hypothetical protein [Rouxiella sp. Mn2063]|uniref:hypothetical protein n=1 Tax=Rouxiella sp. Mn2063 TaxID=3395262 RepID=UPI003BD01A0E
MNIEPGKTGTMKVENGRLIRYSQNKPVTYQFFTRDGSTIEVDLPAGVEIRVISNGDISNINISVFESPSGPTEIVKG